MFPDGMGQWAGDSSGVIGASLFTGWLTHILEGEVLYSNRMNKNTFRKFLAFSGLQRDL